MLLRLLLLLTVVPLVELALLLWLAKVTDLWFTFALVIVTGALGAALARHEGLRCWRRVHDEMAAGRLPGDPLLDGLMILLAGALLVTPGVLTDLVGFGLLLPPFRRVVKRWAARRFQAQLTIISHMGEESAYNGTPERDEIINARVIDVPPEEDEP